MGVNIMTEQEILEGNKLIAEFMGYKYFPNNSLNGIKGVYEKEGKSLMLITDFTYHSSWDWLMPVVEKIGSLECVYHWELTQNTFTIYSDEDFQHFGTDIERVCTTIIEFIKWYNDVK
jgi:hypothetical protein